MMFKKMHRMHEAYDKFIKEHAKRQERKMRLDDTLELLGLSKEIAVNEIHLDEDAALDSYVVAITGYKCGYSMGYDEGLKEEKGGQHARKRNR